MFITDRNAATSEMIVANTYDELGQLTGKKVGNSIAKPLQELDYTYNVRGWLKQINEDNNIIDNDLFNFTINYNTPTNPTKSLYNGNISETLWNTLSANPSGGVISNKYAYTYDALNRITGAIDNTGRYNLEHVTYDKNGNIMSLTRNGWQNSTNYNNMDVLNYNYFNNETSNKLYKVADTGNSSHGYKDGSTNHQNDQDYGYDANGNMIKDANKGITTIEYNHLNLPTYIRSLYYTTLNYVYDAHGTKLAKMLSQRNGATTTEYAGNFIYEKFRNGLAKLKFFNHSEGYVEPKDENNYFLGFNYVYQYKDHLGNIRLSYSDNDGNGDIDTATEIIEENNYYPFGLKHKGYNNVINGTDHKYGFGGKEEQDELGLGWMDVTARNYDPAIGRWMNLDPLAEKMRRHSPYNFGFNNPIYFQDYDGMAPSAPNDCCGGWNPVSGIGEGIARSVESTVNEVSTSIGQTVSTIGSGVQSFVQDNKSTLLGTAKIIQTVGDTTTNVGLTGAALGATASATGIGAVPGVPTIAGGLTVAAAGGVVSLIGDGLELTTNLISGDLGESGENVAVFVAGEVIGNVIDKLIPGPNPDLTPAVKEIIQTTTEVVKNTISGEVKEAVKNKLEDY